MPTTEQFGSKVVMMLGGGVVQAGFSAGQPKEYYLKKLSYEEIIELRRRNPLIFHANLNSLLWEFHEKVFLGDPNIPDCRRDILLDGFGKKCGPGWKKVIDEWLTDFFLKKVAAV